MKNSQIIWDFSIIKFVANTMGQKITIPNFPHAYQSISVRIFGPKPHPTRRSHVWHSWADLADFGPKSNFKRAIPSKNSARKTSSGCGFFAAIGTRFLFSWHKNTPFVLLPNLLSTQIGSTKGAERNHTTWGLIKQLTYLRRRIYYNTSVLKPQYPSTVQS